jgi:alpha-tubulin suppressor-like RCC1 family protein
MPDFPQTITSVALGQDHTLALTSGGYILSWGHNRFSQLGYAIEQPEATPLNRGKEELEVQVSPKRIVGMLKKEFVKGVAAGRMASACWTEDALFTWGTNAGHLGKIIEFSKSGADGIGYDKASNPVQVLPRKVPAISQPVLDVALSVSKIQRSRAHPCRTML